MASVGAVSRKASLIGDLRARAIVRRISPFLRPGDDVLDIGAGSCRVAQLSAAASQTTITAVDTVDHNETDLPLRLYDGDLLPYDDGSFDASILGFVLHHAADFGLVLKEARRVSRSRIIVLEDTPRNKVEHLIWEKGDYHFNHGKHPDIDVAHTVKTHEEWIAYFRDQGLGVVHARPFRSAFLTVGTYTHSLYVLDPRGA
jgi:SAM-dependent methyltransferase